MIDELNVTPACFERIRSLKSLTNKEVFLRLAVDGGGCSGFQYRFELVEMIEPDDHIFTDGDAKLLIDPISLPILKNSIIDYKIELIGSRFIVDNPNASSSCGCGTSFSL